MKRILPLILTVLLLPALLAVPAMAEENGFWYELLDYGVSNHGSNYMSLPTVSKETYFHVEYPNPTGGLLEWVDVLFRTDDTSPRISTSNYDLTVVKLSNQLYRAYGRLNKRQANFGFYHDDGTFLEILSFEASSIYYDSFVCASSGYLTNYNPVSGEPSERFIAYTGSEVGVEFKPAAGANTSYLVDLDVVDWQKFDYIDFHFSVWADSVDSVYAALTDGSLLPVDVSYIDSGVDGNLNVFVVRARVDLTEIVRSSTSDLQFIVSGDALGGAYNAFTLFRVSGIILPVTDNLFVFWFRQLKGWLDSGFSSIVNALGASNDSTGVQENINAAVGELQQAGAALDSVQRPDIGQVNIDVVGMVDPAGLSGVASIVGLFTGNALIYSIMIMFVTLALISYILYGKR